MVFLPEYVRESDGVLDGFLPLRTFESEERFSVAFGNRGQLEKVARNDQLWSIYVKFTR